LFTKDGFLRRHYFIFLRLTKPPGPPANIRLAGGVGLGFLGIGCFLIGAITSSSFV
jgi:hypothetical protein